MVKKQKYTKKDKVKKLTNQDIFLAEYFKQLGHISNACKKAEIGRMTFYKWLNTDEVFKQRFEDAVEAHNDEMEKQIRKIAKGGDKDMLKFWATRKMKHRGFGDKQEVSLTIKNSLTEEEKQETIKRLLS